MIIRVVNKHRKEVGEYIGRGSPLGNPWPIQGFDTREIVIARYKVYLRQQIENGNQGVISELERLGNIAITTGSLNLQCFCSPKPCHGDVIKDLLDKEIAEYMEEKNMPKMILVFGSNEAGIHGKGAAKTAYEKFGARWGKSYGHYGDSFAIPTKNEAIETIADVTRIQGYIAGFIAYAKGHRKMVFQVTRIGCGLAGFTDAQIAPMFIGSPKNCHFDEKWRKYLGDGYNYWGTYSE